jgi:TPR repeat protein
MDIKEIMEKVKNGEILNIFLLAIEYLTGDKLEKNLTKSFELFSVAALNNFAAANFGLAVMYGNGYGVSKDFGKAYDYLEHSASAGISKAIELLSLKESEAHIFKKAYDHLIKTKDSYQFAVFDEKKSDAAAVEKSTYAIKIEPKTRSLQKCVEPGKTHVFGRLSERTFHFSEIMANSFEVSWIHELAEQNDVKAQNDLGVLYFFGNMVPKDISLSKKWFGKAVDLGFDKARTNLASMTLFIVRTPYFDDKFKKFLTDSAEKENSQALFELACLYLSGEGFHADRPKGVRLLTKAARLDHTDAQFFLAQCHALGTGTKINKSEMAYWLAKAAEKGDVEGQHNLGHAYLIGDGVPKDESLGFKWTSLAAKQGFSRSQYALSMLYLKGVGVPKNVQEFKKWLISAADAGHPIAQTQLGELYYHGMHVERDIVKARACWIEAAKNGDEKAKIYLKAVFNIFL